MPPTRGGKSAAAKRAAAAAAAGGVPSSPDGTPTPGRAKRATRARASRAKAAARVSEPTATGDPSSPVSSFETSLVADGDPSSGEATAAAGKAEAAHQSEDPGTTSPKVSNELGENVGEPAPAAEPSASFTPSSYPTAAGSPSTESSASIPHQPSSPQTSLSDPIISVSTPLDPKQDVADPHQQGPMDVEVTAENATVTPPAVAESSATAEGEDFVDASSSLHEIDIQTNGLASPGEGDSASSDGDEDAAAAPENCDADAIDMAEEAGDDTATAGTTAADGENSEPSASEGGDNAASKAANNKEASSPAGSAASTAAAAGAKAGSVSRWSPDVTSVVPGTPAAAAAAAAASAAALASSSQNLVLHGKKLDVKVRSNLFFLIIFLDFKISFSRVGGEEGLDAF